MPIEKIVSANKSHRSVEEKEPSKSSATAAAGGGDLERDEFELPKQSIQSPERFYSLQPISLPDGSQYKGELMGTRETLKPHGMGIRYFDNGKQIEKGEFKNGKLLKGYQGEFKIVKGQEIPTGAGSQVEPKLKKVDFKPEAEIRETVTRGEHNSEAYEVPFDIKQPPQKAPVDFQPGDKITPETNKNLRGAYKLKGNRESTSIMEEGIKKAKQEHERSGVAQKIKRSEHLETLEQAQQGMNQNLINETLKSLQIPREFYEEITQLKGSIKGYFQARDEHGMSLENYINSLKSETEKESDLRSKRLKKLAELEELAGGYQGFLSKRLLQGPLAELGLEYDNYVKLRDHGSSAEKYLDAKAKGQSVEDYLASLKK